MEQIASDWPQVHGKTLRFGILFSLGSLKVDCTPRLNKYVIDKEKPGQLSKALVVYSCVGFLGACSARNSGDKPTVVGVRTKPRTLN